MDLEKEIEALNGLLRYIAKALGTLLAAIEEHLERWETRKAEKES